MSAVIVCDLDGVLWRGDAPIEGAAATVSAWQDSGRRVAFLTNNSSAQIGEVVAKLARMGIRAVADDVASSAQAAAQLLAVGTPPGARVLVAGGPGVTEALAAADFVPVANDAELVEPVEAVVCGFHRDFDFARLDRAAAAIRSGARYIATNLDPTYPGTDRILPGAGALNAALTAATGRVPEVAGKPGSATVALVRARFGADGVVVGDRPSTDGVLADRLGWPFAMVLSGIGGHDPAEPVPEPPPAFLGASLAALAGPLGRYSGA